MKRKRLTAIWTTLLLLAALGTVPAAAQGDVQELVPESTAPVAASGEMADETPELWFVELNSPPAVEGTGREALRAERERFRSDARKAGLRLTERYAFDTLFHGFSLYVSKRDLPALARLPGVKAIYPVIELERPAATATSEPAMESALAMTGADIAQSELGLSGAGIKVAIMDTGVDYHHPDLGGCFGPGCRVAHGYDLVGDAFNASVNPNPVPDDDPDDCGGHGTHVAGIVGANGGVKGVAPGVTFGAYRVFGCSGPTTADIMIAAMERALADGMQVLNMSIGSAFQWPQYPTAVASDRLVNKGVVVVASIGNSGAYGLYSAGAPGLGKKVIGVAAFDNSHVSLNQFTISPDGHAIGYMQAAAAPEAPLSGSVPMARTGTASSTADACSSLPPGSLTGKVALIRRGSCTFHTKTKNAEAAGAIGVVLYNHLPGRFGATVAGNPPVTIPVVSVSDAEGELMDSRLAAGPVTMTWTTETGVFINPTGGLISSFSSYGLSPDLSLKPDIGAPGGMIYSTYPLEDGGYATLSGTSMSAPHVAGAVALLLEAQPHTNAQAVRAILQNSARPKNWWGNPGLGFLDNVHRQGAGMLDIAAAVQATTRVKPGKLSLGESEAGPSTQMLTIENNSWDDRTYTLSHQAALSTFGSTFSPRFATGFASVSFGAASVTIPAGGLATVDVTITAHPGLPGGALYGGYLVLTGDDGSVIRVPYAGYKGDYQEKMALTPTPYGFPWLARIVGNSYQMQGAGAVYTMQGNDLPVFLFHLDHQVRTLRMEVYDAVTGKSWHRALELSYMGRNSASTSFFGVAWDGITMSGKKVWEVPDGQYVLKLSVLKALGDEANPDHWETWTSPMFEIDRP